MIEIHNEQGTYSAKMGADSFAENTQIILKSIWLICPIGPKVWDIVEIKTSLVIYSPCKITFNVVSKYNFLFQIIVIYGGAAAKAAEFCVRRRLPTV